MRKIGGSAVVSQVHFAVMLSSPGRTEWDVHTSSCLNAETVLQYRQVGRRTLPESGYQCEERGATPWTSRRKSSWETALKS